MNKEMTQSIDGKVALVTGAGQASLIDGGLVYR